MKSLADPSIIGTSSLSISINTLSIPKMYKDASKCSTVETLTPNSFCNVVQSFAEDTFL